MVEDAVMHPWADVGKLRVRDPARDPARDRNAMRRLVGAGPLKRTLSSRRSPLGSGG
jgi:hypothetical protein